MAEPIITEEWRPVVGFERVYEVSSLGRIRSRPRVETIRGTVFCRLELGCCIRKLMHNYMGYQFFCARKDGGRHKTLIVHHVVARAFLGERPANLVINHKNGVRNDNRVENLEYVTQSYNNCHAIERGMRGDVERGKALTIPQAQEIKNALRNGTTRPTDLARRFGVSVTVVSNIKHGRTWKHLI